MVEPKFLKNLNFGEFSVMKNKKYEKTDEATHAGYGPESWHGLRATE